MKFHCVVAMLVLLGCDTEPTGHAQTACDAGDGQACVCPTGAGSQTCAADGTRWGACSCDQEPADVGDDGDSGPTDTREDGAADASDTGVDAPDAADVPDAPDPPGGPYNLLLIIVDDLGLDHAACYGVADDIAPTPNIQALCDRGVVFDRAWATPTCSPTRAALLTGQHPYLTGVGRPSGGDTPGIDPDANTLPRAMTAQGLGYATANIGKWHLSGNNNRGQRVPNDLGWDHYSGLIRGAVPDYYAWPKVTDGQPSDVTNYATSEMVDDAARWLGQQQGPWFLWLALNAPHTPFHVPPADLHSYDLGPAGDCPDGQDATCYRAAIQALDAELGRLFEAIGEEEMARTLVVYLGDNGTPAGVAQDPVARTRAKDTLYEGGVHVPFVVAGPHVVGGGRRVDALVDVTDVFPTFLEAAGGTSDPALLGRSLLPYLKAEDTAPQRDFVLTQLYSDELDRGGVAIRDDRFKLIRFLNADESLFDLEQDAWEGDDLLLGDLGDDAQAGYDRLDAQLTSLGL